MIEVAVGIARHGWEELEKSLKERRPASYDGLIKEYFKRIAQ